MKCNGELGKRGSVPGLAAGNLLVCTGCSVCHGNCATCGGTGKVSTFVHGADISGSFNQPCLTYQPMKSQTQGYLDVIRGKP